jgi:hypothetical protein
MQSMKKILSSRRGISALTYAGIVGLVSVVALVGIGPMGREVGTLMQRVGTDIAGEGLATAEGPALPSCGVGEVVTSDGHALSCVSLSDFLSRSAGSGSSNSMQDDLGMGGHDITGAGSVVSDSASIGSLSITGGQASFTPSDDADLATVGFVNTVLSAATGGATEWSSIANRPAHTTADPPSSCTAGQVLHFTGSAWSCVDIDFPAADPDFTHLSNVPSHASASPPVNCTNGQALRFDGTSWSCGTITASAGSVDWTTAVSSRPAHTTAAPPTSCGNDQALRWNGSAWSCGTISGNVAATATSAGSASSVAWAGVSGAPTHATSAPPTCNGANQALRWTGSAWSCGTISGVGFTSCVRRVASSCNGGEVMTGGGCSQGSVASLTNAYPSSATVWTCSAYGASATAYVICCS